MKSPLTLASETTAGGACCGWRCADVHAWGTSPTTTAQHGAVLVGPTVWAPTPVVERGLAGWARQPRQNPNSTRPLFSSQILLLNFTMQKEDSHHIKMLAYA
jgi:hypothetical protein